MEIYFLTHYLNNGIKQCFCHPVPFGSTVLLMKLDSWAEKISENYMYLLVDWIQDC